MNMYRRGFTILEVLIASFVIIVFSATLFSGVFFYQKYNDDIARLAKIRENQAILEHYFFKYNTYPAIAQNQDFAVFGQDALCIFNSRVTDECYIGDEFILVSDLLEGGQFKYVPYYENGGICNQAPCNSFELTFELEIGTRFLSAGPHRLTSQGLE